MPAISVYTPQNEPLKEMTLSETVFSVEPKNGLVHQVVRAQLNSRRRGTAKTKERNEVAGSTRKLFRQKGRGAARKGSVKSPVLVGGGTMFGPIPRSYEFRVPRKARRLALRSALSARFREGAILVVDEFPAELNKTRDVAGLLKRFSLDGLNVMLVTQEMNDAYKALRRCSNNIPGVHVIVGAALNPYDVLRCDVLMFSLPALETVDKEFAL